MNRFVPGAKPQKGQPERVMVRLTNSVHRTSASVVLRVGCLISRATEKYVRDELCIRGKECCPGELGMVGPQEGIPKGYFLGVYWPPEGSDSYNFLARTDFVSLTDDELDKALAEVDRYTGIRLTRSQMRSALNDHPEVRWSIRQSGEICTSEREAILDAIAKNLVGGGWPCYGDSPDRNDAFFRKVIPAAVRAGYQVKAG